MIFEDTMNGPTVRPAFLGAAFGGESISIRSGDTELRVFRRTTGWGWAELIGPDGDVLAVLDHLGELALRDALVPMRLESPTVARSVTDGRDRLVFAVESTVTADALDSSSFGEWVGVPFRGPLLTGDVVLESAGDGSYVLEWRLESHFDVFARWLRGPWLRVGATSFGAGRDEAVLPGIDWALDREWTSGNDAFRDPWALRAVPPVDSVSVPTMVIARQGRYVALSWEPDSEATGWFSMPPQRLQPVFASPNFVERDDSSLLGLMLPESRDGSGDRWSADPPLELHRGQRIALRARVTVGAGAGVDAVTDWVLRSGLPTPPEERWPLDETLHRIARAYSTTFWHPGSGFGLGQSESDVRPEAPAFAAEYLATFPDTREAHDLRERIRSLPAREPADQEPADQQPTDLSDRLRREADTLVTDQGPDGSFRFDPQGRHRSKDDFVVARDLVAPMGAERDAALDMDVVPAITLLRAYEAAADTRHLHAALRALDHARAFVRPEGGDFWETPLRSANLLAAGHATVAYALAARITGDDAHLGSSRYWLRSILVFTHLWSPRDRPMLYNTKPCFASSDWYFANWVRDHVQWEVLESFALAHRLGIDLPSVDPDLDWARFHEGVTWAGVRWLIDHRDATWRPHNKPASRDLYDEGRFDLCLPDTHSSTTGRYGGMAIPPSTVAVNLLAIRARRRASL